MKIKNLIIKLAFVFLLIRLLGASYAQERGFLITFVEEDHSWQVTDALETSDGEFLVCAFDRWGDESVLLRLSSEGEMLAQTTISVEDTAVYAYRCIRLPEAKGDECVLLCPCSPDHGGTEALLVIRLDEDLNVTYRKMTPCGFFDEGSRHFDAKFLLSGKYIYAALTAQPPILPYSVFLVKMDLDGNLIHCQRQETLTTVCNLFQAEDDKVGLFSTIDNSHMGIMTYSPSLQLVNIDTIFQWSSPEGVDGDFCHYSIMDMINSQAGKLSDGSYVVSARLLESLHHANGYPYANDRSVILAKYDDSFHQPENMLVTEHMNDSLEYPAFFRSMDFKETVNEECNVFQCSILNELPQYGFMQQPYPTGIVVTKIDQDFNVEWKKRYLRDGNYQAMVINATSDGGCLVAGSVGDYQAQRFDVFALKINADGTVGLDEIEEESMAYVYPNPVKEAINIGGVEAKETEVYNALGQRVMNFHGNEANVEALAEGVYLLRVTDDKGLTHTIRIVVNK